MNSKTVVDNIVNQKSFAFVGVSRSEKKFSIVIYKELKKKGMNAYPVNPNMNEFERKKCYQGVADIPDTVDGAIINVLLTQTETVIIDAHTARINKVCLQQGLQSETAAEYCEEHNIDCVSNECILMLLEPAGFIHRAHRWVWCVLGKLPR